MYEDLLYDVDEGVATITINRPERMNAFRAVTLNELVDALHAAWRDPEVGVVILTGAGDRAFCVGGDAEDSYDADMVELVQNTIRSVPMPVIAAVNGFAIGGGHVLHVICDMTVAADTARFGQVGPKVGSVDPGYGVGLLARAIGTKRAYRMWALCERYTAEEALEMGLVNRVVPADELLNATREWAAELLQRSPTALNVVKATLGADTASIGGLTRLGYAALPHYYRSAEAAETRSAFQEKRAPVFSAVQ
jgi:dihydroxynaphthoic acid synthetase